ncbi:MAG: ABC transporter permease [Selenomonadaceae bacterium]|nr:ABC transporter permease [Selenomonadaceae bacterium]
MGSFKSEIGFLFSGKGMPYEKVCILVAMVISIFLTLLMSGNFAKDAPIAVIDLDNSHYSRELISQIEASEYMQVSEVLYTPIDPQTLFYRDHVIAVVYFPRELEKNRYSGNNGVIGVFYDYTNTAQAADIKQALNSLVAEDNASAIQATGGTNTGTVTLSSRNLFNPAGSTSNGQTQGFLFFFGSMFFVFATIGMIPRLRMTHQLDDILLNGTPWELLAKIVPYAFLMVISFFFGMAILRIWGDLVFSGALISFLIIQIFYSINVGILSLLVGWTAPNPGLANSRMIFLIPGGFILGGVTAPIAKFAPWVIAFSHIFPLTWEFHFTRDIIQRGATLTDISSEVGAYFVYIAICAIWFCWRFYHDKEVLQTQPLVSE